MRQVLALLAAPFLLDDPGVTTLFPVDAVSRARTLLSYFAGGLGAYSDSRGAPGIRQEVADFIAARDGHPSSPDAIFLTEGASPSVKYMLTALIRDERDAILCPIPQYPLYSATIALAGGTLLGYELDESQGWGMHVHALKAQVAGARAKGLAVRALVFINPGNPTGQCLTEANLRDIVRFCHEERLVLLGEGEKECGAWPDHLVPSRAPRPAALILSYCNPLHPHPTPPTHPHLHPSSPPDGAPLCVGEEGDGGNGRALCQFRGAGILPHRL